MLPTQHSTHIGAEPVASKPVLLIVDDDADDRKMLIDAALQANKELNIKAFGNGLELLQYLSDLPADALPQLLFLDLQMPLWDGIRTLQTLEKNPRYAAIQKYMVSLADTEYEVSLSLRCGAKEFIVKPCGESQRPAFYQHIVDAVRNSMIGRSADSCIRA